MLVNAAGETLTDPARRQIEAAFGCRVGNYYGSSEAVGLTFECAVQRLHVNSDWYILEPVDDQDRPVPPGELSHDVLVTNLANRIQPIIRYALGDQVSIGPNPVPAEAHSQRSRLSAVPTAFCSSAAPEANPSVFFH